VEAAKRLGAAEVLTSSKGAEIIAAIAKLTGSRTWGPRWKRGLPMLAGGVDAVYDSICSPETLEIGVRVTRPRGILSIIGVEAPKRFEWTPIYFKELRVVGANAFGIEEFRGVRKHAMEHYLDLCASGEVDLTTLVTHRYPLDDWRAAMDGRATLPPRPVLITFDDGYRSVLRLGAPILAAHGLPAVVFVCTGPMPTRAALWFDEVAARDSEDAVDAWKSRDYDAWREACVSTRALAEDDPRILMTADELAALSRMPGIEIGGHTVRHPILARASAARQREEIEETDP